MNRDVAISIKYLSITAAVFFLGAGAAFTFRFLGIKSLPCGFYDTTGLYCLTCGATRATLALTRFEIVRSVLFNPLPVMIVIYLLVVMIFEIVCIIRKKRVVVQWLPWNVISMLFVLIVFFILRNTGIIPMPV